MNGVQSFEIRNPFDLSVIATRTFHDGLFAERALETAFQRFRQHRRGLPRHVRQALLEKSHALLSGRRTELANLVAREGGKPLRDAEIEVDRGLQGIRLAASHLNHMCGSEVPMGLNAGSEVHRSFTQRLPCGVVLAISAFNHPFNLIVHQVITAVAAGCPVLVKPSLETPLTCEAIVDALHEAGLPEGWCQILLIDNETAETVARDRRIHFLNFVGSARVGWKLRSQLPHGANCLLEHGGSAPVIIDRSAHIKALLPGLTRAGYYHAGQVCVSAQRIYVHEDLMQAFCNAFAQAVSALRVGDPTLPETDVGPLIRPTEVARVHQWVSEAVGSGSRLLVGGSALSETLYAPTLLVGLAEGSRMATDEVFGPVCAIQPFRDLEEAVRLANSVPFAFQSSVYTQDIDRAWWAADRLEASTVMINEQPAFRVDWMPFGGYKESGTGTGGIAQTIEALAPQKQIVIRSASPDGEKLC